MIRIIPLFILLALFFARCGSSDTAVLRTYSHLDNGDSILQLEYQVSNNELNGYYKVYYDNGVQKVESRYKNGFLDEIVFVHDRNGNELDFGKLVDGKGCVKIYFDDTSIVKREGCFVKGQLSGKWSTFNYKGEFIRDEFYNKGHLKEYGDVDFSYYH